MLLGSRNFRQQIDLSGALKFFEALFLPFKLLPVFLPDGADLLPLSFGPLLGRGGFCTTLPLLEFSPFMGLDLSGDISTSVQGFESHL